jgi:hypothetical protein
MANDLKPFVINGTDIQFLLDQVTFQPLFDSLGNAIINWDGTGAVYDGNHKLLWDPAVVTPQLYNGVTLNAANVLNTLGGSYQNITDLAGLRDPSGFNNNLTLSHAHWGQANQIFPRMATADFTKYSQEILNIAPDTAFGASTSVTAVTAGTPTYTVVTSTSNSPGGSTTTSAGITVNKVVVEEIGTAVSVDHATTTAIRVQDGHHKAITQTETSITDTTVTSTFAFDKTTTTTTVNGNAGQPVVQLATSTPVVGKSMLPTASEALLIT